MLMELVWTYNEFEAAVTAAAAANGKPTDNELSLIKEFLNQYHINNTKNKRSSYLIEMLTNYNATQIPMHSTPAHTHTHAWTPMHGPACWSTPTPIRPHLT